MAIKRFILPVAPIGIMAKGRKKGSKKKGKPVVLKKTGRQVGRSNRSIDKELHAIAPGQRRSGGGKKYWETRKNRSDLKDGV